jgi:hypothetical protein
VAASLVEIARDGGSVADRVAAFDVLVALGMAYFRGGRIEQADVAYRRAERFEDAVSAAKLADFEFKKTYVRADRGQPAAFPVEYVDRREGDLERPADSSSTVATTLWCSKPPVRSSWRSSAIWLPRLSAARPSSAR